MQNKGRFSFLFNLCLILLMSTALPAAAQTIKHLYQAEVPVNGRGQAVRAKALQQALKHVLMKLSGQREWLQRPEVRKQLTQADPLVQGYVYESRPQAPGALPQSVLVVNFHPADVRAFMQRLHIPLWSADRPLVLVWLALASEGLASQEDQPHLFDALLKAAEQRGLPVLLPLLDLADRQQMKASQMMSLKAEDIWQSAERYKPDVVALVEVKPLNNQWVSDWKVYTHSSSLDWQEQKGSMQAALEVGIGHLTDKLAAQTQLADLSSQAIESLELRIDNVNSYQDYARIYKYLQALGMVTSVELKHTQPGQLLLALQARGGAVGFQQATQLNEVLIPAPVAEKPDSSHAWMNADNEITDATETGMLHYIYQP